MNTLKNVLYFAVLSLLIVSCTKEENLIPIIDEAEPRLENRNEDYEEGNCQWKMAIVEQLPACYPSPNQYGRYELLGLPEGKNVIVKWETEHATIIHNEGDEIYVSPDSPNDYIVKAFVKLQGCPLKSVYHVYTPSTDCPY